MAQVTYRGVQYDTNERKQAKPNKSELTYRGVEYDTDEYNAAVIEESHKRNRHDLMYRGLKVNSKASPCS